MKTIAFIGITAVVLALAACSNDEPARSSREPAQPQANTATTSDTQHGTLLQGSSYDTGNHAAGVAGQQ